MTMTRFFVAWSEAAVASLGLFWMALWAFALGYLVSGMVQVFVTRQRIRRAMGEPGPRAVALGTLFGLLSSSCSFAALATTRALFAKGAGLVPSLAFLLASTNLVIELGIVIAVFLSWQFVVGEYLGGVLLILAMWLVVRLTGSKRLIERARERARTAESSDDPPADDWRRLVRTREGWRRVGDRYAMEWGMVWKDVTIGFTVAGIIATFVPRQFFETLFIGAGVAAPGFSSVVFQCLVAPLAAFFTFIGSMGNIPLAAVLYQNGVAFGGIMAFIFSDLVVLPVLRIQARYYGWRMAAYIVIVFLVILVVTAVALHYGFAALGLLPDASAVRAVADRRLFALDRTAFLNGIALIVTTAIVAGKVRRGDLELRLPEQLGERLLFALAMLCYAWIGGGLAAAALTT